MIRGRTNPGKGAGWEGGAAVSGGRLDQWSAGIAVPVVVLVANQEGEGVGGAGKGWEELAAPPGVRRAQGEREKSG